MSSHTRPTSVESQLATTPAAQAPTKLVIASRESRLALWQAEHVRAALQQYYPACDVSILGMTTRGDQILDRSLAKVGGKGLFVKELEVALAEGRADLAVHSLKDVPMELPEGFALPAGAVVGTSSLRREASLRARFPHLVIQPLRGNLDTRLGKLDRGDYAAIILAAAGLKRLGLADRIRSTIAPEESLPAAGQGALGIESRADRADVLAALAPLHHAPTALAVTAERAVSRILGGSCQVPLASFAQWSDAGTLRLRAFVASQDGTRKLAADGEATPATLAEADALGVRVAQQMLAGGARDILAMLGADAPPAT